MQAYTYEAATAVLTVYFSIFLLHDIHSVFIQIFQVK